MHYSCSNSEALTFGLNHHYTDVTYRELIFFISFTSIFKSFVEFITNESPLSRADDFNYLNSSILDYIGYLLLLSFKYFNWFVLLHIRIHEIWIRLIIVYNLKNNDYLILTNHLFDWWQVCSLRSWLHPSVIGNGKSLNNKFM